MRILPRPKPIHPRAEVVNLAAILSVTPASEGMHVISFGWNRLWLLVGNSFETILAPPPAQRPDLMPPTNFSPRFRAVRVDQHIVRSMFVQLPAASHRRNETVGVFLHGTDIRSVQKHQPGRFGRGKFYGNRLVANQHRLAYLKRQAPGDNVSARSVFRAFPHVAGNPRSRQLG